MYTRLILFNSHCLLGKTLPHPAWMPSLNVGDELGIVPKDDMILLMRLLDDARLFVVTCGAMGFAVIESGREVPAS